MFYKKFFILFDVPSERSRTIDYLQKRKAKQLNIPTETQGLPTGTNLEVKSIREKIRDNKYNPYWMFRDNPSLKNKLKDFPKKYNDILTESEDKAKQKAQRYGKPYDPYDGQATRVIEAFAKTGWHKVAKPPLQYLGGKVGEMVSGISKQVPGMDGMVDGFADKLGIKIKTAKDKDIMLDNSDGTISLNKEFFKNRGKLAVPELILNLQIKAGRHILQILGALSSFAWCASMGPAGGIIACILISMAMKNTIKNMTIDVFKQLLATAYSVLVYGFKGEDATKIKLVDSEGKPNPKLVKALFDLESGKIPLLPLPDKIKKDIDKMFARYDIGEIDGDELEQEMRSIQGRENIAEEVIISEIERILTNPNLNASASVAEEVNVLINQERSASQVPDVEIDRIAALFRDISPTATVIPNSETHRDRFSRTSSVSSDSSSLGS